MKQRQHNEIGRGLAIPAITQLIETYEYIYAYGTKHCAKELRQIINSLVKWRDKGE